MTPDDVNRHYRAMLLGAQNCPDPHRGLDLRNANAVVRYPVGKPERVPHDPPFLASLDDGPKAPEPFQGVGPSAVSQSTPEAVPSARTDGCPSAEQSGVDFGAEACPACGSFDVSDNELVGRRCRACLWYETQPRYREPLWLRFARRLAR